MRENKYKKWGWNTESAGLGVARIGPLAYALMVHLKVKGRFSLPNLFTVQIIHPDFPAVSSYTELWPGQAWQMGPPKMPPSGRWPTWFPGNSSSDLGQNIYPLCLGREVIHWAGIYSVQKVPGQPVRDCLKVHGHLLTVQFWRSLWSIGKNIGMRAGKHGFPVLALSNFLCGLGLILFLRWPSVSLSVKCQFWIRSGTVNSFPLSATPFKCWWLLREGFRAWPAGQGSRRHHQPLPRDEIVEWWLVSLLWDLL